ncbi:MAG: hypothetical protein QUS14_05225 [Pyrinomonadaceae bacterium]|nr:hypothetical protein [Pyrinomonadaceae bacterium]
MIVAFDGVEWYFLSFIEDPRYNFPLTLIYISVGYIGLTVGYFLPIGRWFAEKTEKVLPKWNWEPDRLWAAGMVLVFIGIGINVFGFLQGLLGFQRNISIGEFDGLLSFLLVVLTFGTVLLWLSIFSAHKRTGMYYIVLTVLLALIPLRMAVLGSRSSLVLSLVPIAFAFVYSGRKLRIRIAALFSVLAVIALFIGIVYGTTFRNIKGSEARVNAGDYFGQVVATVDYLLDEDPLVVLGDSMQTLASRVENLSSVAIVVSNYEKLAPYEASYGLENNILNDLYTSFIPRFVWADKPPTSDPRAYSDLYFNYGENSFAISPFADLLRNFGPIGVPLGMLLLGIYLRFIYSGLIQTPNPSIWRKATYFLLLTVVSYEAFYATIFPSVIRTIFVVGLAIILMRFFISEGNKPVRAA